MILHAITLFVVLLLVEPREGNSCGQSGGVTSNSFFKQIREGWLFMKTNVPFLSICLFGALLYSMSWSISFYSQVLFQAIGLSNKIIGTLGGIETWVAAGVAAIAFLGERRLGKRGSLFISGCGFIVCLAAFASQTGPVQVVVAYFSMSVFVSYLEPLLEAYLNEQLPASMRATMLSVFNMLISTGMMVTFSFIGFLADWTDLPTALKFTLMGWVPVCLAAMLWAVSKAKV